MVSNELKCIEVLMRHLIKDTDLYKDSFSAFGDSSTYDSTRNNLFNLITINNLVDVYYENPPFSLEDFLFKGTITGVYEEPIQTPSVDVQFHNNIQSFYRYLIEALREGNYVFDDENNLFVSSEKVETSIPQIWLYRLSSVYKKNTFKDMFLFNKRSENNILDRNGLIDYIRHTKTFFVSLTSSDSSVDNSAVYESTREATIASFRERKEVKVDDVIETFKSLVPDNVDAKVSKYKIADAFWLVSKAESYQPNFYTLSLNEQQRLIKTWLLEFINSNDLANKQAQKFILVSSLNNDSRYRSEDIPKNEVIVGLFNLYISLINELNIDFGGISLTDFRLSSYISPELQEKLIKLNKLIKVINREHSAKVDHKDRAAELLNQLKELDASSPEFEETKAKYAAELGAYQEREATEDSYAVTRNQLQAEITEEQKSSIANIAFDNDKIMELILEATKKGRICINQKGSSLYIELYNDTLGKTVFKASISLEQLLEFITNVNLSLTDYGYTKRAN